MPMFLRSRALAAASGGEGDQPKSAAVPQGPVALTKLRRLTRTMQADFEVPLGAGLRLGDTHDGASVCAATREEQEDGQGVGGRGGSGGSGGSGGGFDASAGTGCVWKFTMGGGDGDTDRDGSFLSSAAIQRPESPSGLVRGPPLMGPSLRGCASSANSEKCDTQSGAAAATSGKDIGLFDFPPGSKVHPRRKPPSPACQWPSKPNTEAEVIRLVEQQVVRVSDPNHAGTSRLFLLGIKWMWYREDPLRVSRLL